MGENVSDVLEPGTPSSSPLTAYWFGPTLGPRRAILATELQVDMSNTDEEKLFSLYITFYQLPEDGCQSGMLPGYEESPDYWGPGREVQVLSEPLGTPLTQRTIREVYGGREGKPRVDLTNGETAIFLGGGNGETAVVVGRALVTVNGLPPDRAREFLPQLRRLEPLVSKTGFHFDS
ncbi:MAG: hypothetical protein ABI649_01145 [Gaiellaceae bacterium]